MSRPTLVITNANILTLNPRQPLAQAIAVKDGRICALGCLDDVKPFITGSQLVDARGATVVPGFIDTHAHFLLSGLTRLALDLSGVSTISGVLECLSQEAANTPQDWVIFASQFAPELVHENRFPTPSEMDLACCNRPVYIMERTGHWAAVNNAALRLAGVSENEPGCQVDSQCCFNGVITGKANSQVDDALWPVFVKRVDLKQAVHCAAKMAVKGGITTLHALDDLQDVTTLLEMEDQLPVRLIPYTQTKDVQAVLKLGLKQIGGCAGMILDGDFGPHTAALLEPYQDRPDTQGVLYWSDAELESFVFEAHCAGLQIALHCVGSGAIEQLMNAYEKALQALPRPDHRHRIEHFELPAAHQFKRAKRLGLHLAVQPAFNYYWPHDSEEYPRVIGNVRALQVDPLCRLLKSDLPVALGSDSPVTPLCPLLGIHSAVNHSNPVERISAEQALYLSTTAGAQFAFEENEKGSLEIGKLGDFVLLAQNPLQVAAEKIKDIEVLKTIVGGEIVYDLS